MLFPCKREPERSGDPRFPESREAMKTYYVYILASKRNGTLYIGVTNDLIRRIYEHKEKMIKSFTKKYNINKLVYYEVFEDIENAILREKQIKGGSRQKKVDLINRMNKEWNDLYFDLE